MIKMKKRDVIILICIVIIFAIIFAFIKQVERNKWLEKIAAKAEGERDYYKKAYLNKLETMLVKSEAPSEILKELEALKDHYENLDIEVHKQLNTVIKLLNDDHKEKAIFDLSKIVEVLLKKSYQKIEQKKCKIRFYQLLDYAKGKNWFNEVDHSFAMNIKQIRNEEGHQLNVEIDTNEAYLAIFSGIHLAHKLSTI